MSSGSLLLSACSPEPTMLVASIRLFLTACCFRVTHPTTNANWCIEAYRLLADHTAVALFHVLIACSASAAKPNSCLEVTTTVWRLRNRVSHGLISCRLVMCVLSMSSMHSFRAEVLFALVRKSEAVSWTTVCALRMAATFTGCDMLGFIHCAMQWK